MHVNDLLKIAVESSASDLHLKVGSLPMMRVRGALVPASTEKKRSSSSVDWKAVINGQSDFLKPLVQEVVQQVLEATPSRPVTFDYLKGYIGRH